MALPSAVTYVKGMKDSEDVVSQEKPLELGDKIWMHDPNRNKGLAWLMRNGKTVPTKQSTFYHLEDVPFPSWVKYTGATESTQGATGLVFESGTNAKLGLGSRLYNTRTGEIMRFSAAFASSTTSGAVVRNTGAGSSTDYLYSGDILRIIPPAMEQGFEMQSGLSNPMVLKTFYTTEISYPVEVTNVEYAEEHRGGNSFKRALKKRIKQCKDQQEGEAFLGGSYSLSAGPTDSRVVKASEGALNWISTHAYTASTLSRMDLWDILAEWSAMNHEGGAILCSMAFKAMVTEWALDITTINVPIAGQKGEGVLGLSVDRIRTPFGVYDLVDIDLFNQDPYLMGTVIFAPKGRVNYRPLKHYEDLDVRYVPVNQDEVHAHQGEIYGVYGWEFFEEEMWAKLTGLNFAA